ncbi:b1b05159-2bf5-4807-bf1c-276728322fec [Sclerotinia trifoliorum]|uniref:B1b05159-2bf5-4807-bf1c-276728322fec n=1 Tax=Sclerotinia trifoliorum TaxID=28548 RepID=A0A8H2VRY2_9HELO|nr:b1b05159-2bf5-4807-bf1c-276728322fec [Sclerotinia trifoliorum]
MESTKKWADGPFKLLSTPRASLEGKPELAASRNASEMALVHNILLRGLNSIYLQAANVKETSDISDFMKFCDAWSSNLHSHHAAEETVYFKMLDEQSSRDGVFIANHTEHEKFLPGLFAFDLYVSGVKDNAKPYDGLKLTELIDVFGTDLENHLHHEIAVLEDLEKDASINWEKCGKAMAQYSKKHADKVRDVPFLITNSDVTYESGIHGPRFPPFPWFVGLIFRWIYIPKLKGAWRFSSCDDYGIPKELPFA